MGSEVITSTLTPHETIPDELLAAMDLVLVAQDAEREMLLALSRAIHSGQSSSKVFVLGSAEIPSDLAKLLPSANPLRLPLDYSYLRGVLDSAHLDGARIRRMDEEQSRIHRLYEISSSLLKIGSREQIPAALENALPALFDSDLIMLVFPAENFPLIFMHHDRDRPLTSKLMGALRTHLAEAWDILRSDCGVSWEWVDALAAEECLDQDIKLVPTSFMTTPISFSGRTEGFLTLLPRQQEKLEEVFLQSFFMVGDLISVLLHNIELNERLQERAMHDGLTRLLNRQTVLELLDRECRRCQRYGSEISVVMFDIDHFKSVNDLHGHLAGDEALRFVAELVRQSVREMDLVGRCGGEEFIVVLVNTSLLGASAWSERFRALLESQLVRHGEVEFKLTASFGVASGWGEDAETNDLLARADAALYQAKNEGRNRVCTAPGIDREAPAIAPDTPLAR